VAASIPQARYSTDNVRSARSNPSVVESEERVFPPGHAATADDDEIGTMLVCHVENDIPRAPGDAL
jgi:2-iminoacetate synthase ThiH